MDGEPIACSDVSPVGECMERCHEPTTKARHIDRRNPVGELHDVVIGSRDMHLLSECAHCLVSKPERNPVRADIRPAVFTQLAGPIPEVKRDGDVIAFTDALNVLADGDDVASWFVPKDMTLVEFPATVLPIAVPGVPVAPTNPARIRFDNYPVRIK